MFLNLPLLYGLCFAYYALGDGATETCALSVYLAFIFAQETGDWCSVIVTWAAFLNVVLFYVVYFSCSALDDGFLVGLTWVSYAIFMLSQDMYYLRRERARKELIFKDYEMYEIAFREFMRTKNNDFTRNSSLVKDRSLAVDSTLLALNLVLFYGVCFAYYALDDDATETCVLVVYLAFIFAQNEYRTRRARRREEQLLKDYERYNTEFREFLRGRGINYTRDRWWV